MLKQSFPDERAKRSYFERHGVDRDSAVEVRKRYDMLVARRRAHDKKARAREGMAERYRQRKKENRKAS